MLDIRVGSDWLIFCWLNFEGCQLWHQLSQTFLHQFFKFLCPSCCKIPEFSKTPPTSYIWMNLKEVVTKNQKNKKSEKCQFEPTLKCYHFCLRSRPIYPKVVCAHHAAKFLNFPKHPKLLRFG